MTYIFRCAWWLVRANACTGWSAGSLGHVGHERCSLSLRACNPRTRRFDTVCTCVADSDDPRIRRPRGSGVPSRPCANWPERPCTAYGERLCRCHRAAVVRTVLWCDGPVGAGACATQPLPVARDVRRAARLVFRAARGGHARKFRLRELAGTGNILVALRS